MCSIQKMNKLFQHFIIEYARKYIYYTHCIEKYVLIYIFIKYVLRKYVLEIKLFKIRKKWHEFSGLLSKK